MLSPRPQVAPRILLALVATTLLAIPSSPWAAPVEVTGCGQSVSGRGFLTGDLDCPGSNAAVVIERGSLALNGFTISGATVGVRCPRRCKIEGPGTIRDNSFDGIDAKGTAKVSNVSLIDNGRFGIQCFVSCNLDGPGTISGHTDYGAVTVRSLKIRDMTITDNPGGGLLAGNIKENARVTLRDSVVTNNAFGLMGDKIKVIDSEVSGNAAGGIILAGPQGNSCAGRRIMRVKGSVVTGNDVGAACGVSETCADLMSCRPPRLNDTTCDTSYVLESGFPGDDWDVCTFD